MKDLNMSDDGDLQFTGGRLTFVDGDELIRQNLLKRIRTYAGEWFLNINRGMPYLQAIFVKGVEEDLIRSFFVNEILSVAGVKELSSLDVIIDAASRGLTVEFEVRTINGETLSLSEEV